MTFASFSTSALEGQVSLTLRPLNSPEIVPLQPQAVMDGVEDRNPSALIGSRTLAVQSAASHG
jgi:hypothetical protein